MAARPSARPVRPRPSVVVPETDTGAPAAAASAFCASSRRLPIFGRTPITWIAMLPISKPSARTMQAASARSVTAGGAGPLGPGGAEVRAEVAAPAAEKRASQAACAATSPSECPARPSSPSHSRPAAPQFAAGLEGVHVGADADERDQRGGGALAGVGAGGTGGTSRHRWPSCGRVRPRRGPGRAGGSP